MPHSHRTQTPDGPWCYPDIVVACGPEPDDPYIEDAPCVLIEVLSPTTASTDRREKLLAYRRIPSLQVYLLIEQDRPMVECHCRDADSAWQGKLTDIGTIDVPCLATALSLEDIYAGA
jgi:Uma2 family endonuclease